MDTLFYGKNGLKNKIPKIGVSIGIYQAGKSNFYSFGNTGHTTNEKIDSNTVFEIGSNTKLFTSLLLALEIEKGKIKEDALIDNYLPRDISLQPNLKNKIRLTDLASFSSGLPTLHDDIYDSLLSVKDSMQSYKLVDKKYLFNILNNTTDIKNYGKYEYSNFSYGLLGAILEKATKKNYSNLLRKNIFRPLKLKNTFTDKVKTKNVALAYYENKEVGYLQLDALKSAGVIKSDAVDMLRFLKLQLYPGENLMGSAIKLTQHEFTIDSDLKVGLGWHILSDEENENKSFYAMQGDTIGNSSLLFFDKNTDLAIVILINESNHNLTGILLDYLINNVPVAK